MSADRADSNGGAHSDDDEAAAPSSTGSGVPGMAMSASSAARAASLAMSTRCRGNRSASVDSSGPPSSHGR